MALGVPYVGAETADILADKMRSVDKLAVATEEGLLTIEGVGPKVAESIVTFFADEDNQEEIFCLLECGVKPYLKKREEAHLFAGKTFVLTGGLHENTRDQVALLIKERGGKVSSSVSRVTDYVLVGENPGSKYIKAKELGIQCLSEQEFLALVV